MTSKLWQKGHSDPIVIGLLCLIYCAIAAYGGDRFFSAIHPDFLDGYHAGAWSIKNGMLPLGPDGHLVTHWPPGYSLLIAPFVTADPAESITRLRWLISVLALIHVFQLYAIARILLPETPCWIAVAPAVLWPPLLPLLNPAASGMLFMILMNASILVLLVTIRHHGWKLTLGLLATGVFLGAAMGTRAIGIALAIAFLITLLFYPRFRAFPIRLVSLILVTVTALATISPWLLIMKQETGTAKLNTSALAVIEQSFREHEDNAFAQKLFLQGNLESFSSTGAALADAAVSKPGSALAFFASRVVKPWYVTFSGRLEPLLMVFNLPMMVLFVLSSIFLIWSRKPLGAGSALVWLIVCGFWGLSFLTYPIFRFIAPILPLAWLFILIGFNELLQHSVSRLGNPRQSF